MELRRHSSQRRRLAIVVSCLVIILLVPLAASAAGSKATSPTPNKGGKAPAGSLTENQRRQTGKETELAAAQKTDIQLEASLKELGEQLVDSQHKIIEARGRVEKADHDVVEVQGSIEVAQTEIDGRTKSVNNRAVDIYKNPDRGSVDALLGSENIADAGLRMGLVNRVVESDTGEMRRLSALKQDLREDEDHLVLLQAEAKAAREAQENEQNRLETLQARQEATKRANDSRIRELQEEVAALEKEEAAIQATLARSMPAVPGAGPQGNVSVHGNGKFGWPVGGSVTSEFGQRCLEGSCRMHAGIDIGAGMGAAVGAAGSGTVIFAGSQGGYGNCVIINHGDGFATLYGHLSAISVTNGQSVGRGTRIGSVGNTGHSTGPHLHFEVRVGGAAQNPRLYL